MKQPEMPEPTELQGAGSGGEDGGAWYLGRSAYQAIAHATSLEARVRVNGRFATLAVELQTRYQWDIFEQAEEQFT